MTRKSPGVLWALLAASLPMFMGSLDNLVVTTALSTIAGDFDTTQAELQWVVNGYTLPFSGALLAGAVLGDRIGRRRVFLWGIGSFTVASAICAMADSVGWLVFARVLQGAGAGLILPVSLTLAVAAVSREQRNMAVGVWGAVNGIGIAVGPLAGGLVTEGLDWSWIFWINVPVGLIAFPLALWAIKESRGEDRSLNVTSLVLIVGAVVVAVWGIVQAADHGWGETNALVALVLAVVLLAGYIAQERRASQPLIPLRMYRIPAFMLSNAVAFTMYFGVFGSIFFLAQFLQGPMGYGPLEAGLRTLPWTAAPMVAVPIVSALVDRFGGGILQAIGSGLQAVALAWIALVAEPDLSYGAMVAPMILAGIGMGMVFAANPATVIGSVRDSEHNKASGVNNTVREFGGALGIAVLTTIFTHGFDGHPIVGPEDAGEAFVAGLEPALWFGVAVVGLGAVAGLFIRHTGGSAEPPAEGSAAERGLPEQGLTVTESR
ncbi:MFS transporter [Streptomyces hainanensis]|uniref:DHA2 family efflux MFS transporter permease subunit n=1 Tax=Streptomyces hainanensis TaxID=402648 RepID=A0A4R4TDA3_9ACTN|nr:MFS transporter [Streptomyces hainanensis]TDC74136.1 DHA2 family efflux MFS transporter permease subunit [Streptomyces hainanensis]